MGPTAVKTGKAAHRRMSARGIVLGPIWLVVSVVATIAFVFFIADATTKTGAATDEDFLDSSPVITSCSVLTNSEIYCVENYVRNASTWDTDTHTVVCGLSNASGPVDDGAVIND